MKISYTTLFCVGLLGLLAISLTGCIKQEEKIIYRCQDPYAVNYGVPMAVSICRYPFDRVINKSYNLILTSYPLVVSYVGNKVQVIFKQGY